jgi:hypothetical protein
MANLQAFEIDSVSPKTSMNLLNNFNTFNKNTGFGAWTVQNGTGVGTNINDDFYYGDGSLYLFSTDNDADLIVIAPSTLTRVTITKTGYYPIQFHLKKATNSITSGDFYTLKIAKNGVNWTDIFVDISQMRGISDTWIGFRQQLYLTAGDYLDFSHLLPANGALGVGIEHVVRFDGFKLEYDDKQLGFGSAYSEPYNNIPTLPSTGDYIISNELGYVSLKKILTWEGLLNFPSTINGASSDLTVTIPNCVDKDVVELGVLASLKIVVGNEFNAFVSAPNIVTVRYTNNTGATVDLPNSQFKIKVLQ